ncbi:hypothetical protein [Parvibium lacunae]|uniref:Uncharacterized protein n=1 Tax=Parvibium lacunae TaxID=1888893 RepID=A0A368L831_9BURK|nr:hypothetical protein [Parvibium lacunae]RCS59786.1 hypothetical protein DU000_03530 [Parvibium lacunae]
MPFSTDYLIRKPLVALIPFYGGRRLWCLAGVVLLAGCSQLGVVRTDIATQYPLASLADTSVASTARQAVAAERLRVEQAAAQRRAECYEKFYANNCLNDLRQDEVNAERALFAVDTEARRVLREARFQEDAARIAAKQAESLERAAAEAAERQRQAQAYRERLQAQEAAEAVREIEANLAAQRGQVKQAEIKARVTAKEQAQQAAEKAFLERAANREAYAKKLEEAKRHADEMAAKRAKKGQSAAR